MSDSDCAVRRWRCASQCCISNVSRTPGIPYALFRTRVSISVP